MANAENGGCAESWIASKNVTLRIRCESRAIVERHRARALKTPRTTAS